jgi:PAS domain-containing serine/threonine kinase
MKPKPLVLLSLSDGPFSAHPLTPHSTTSPQPIPNNNNNNNQHYQHYQHLNYQPPLSVPYHTTANNNNNNNTNNQHLNYQNQHYYNGPLPSPNEPPSSAPLLSHPFQTPFFQLPPVVPITSGSSNNQHQQQQQQQASRPHQQPPAPIDQNPHQNPNQLPFTSIPPPTPNLPPNHILNPDFARRYALGPCLGSGGFGFVCSAVRLADNREVAVKFILKKKVPPRAWARDAVLGIIPTEIYILKNVSIYHTTMFLSLLLYLLYSLIPTTTRSWTCISLGTLIFFFPFF